MKLIRIYEQLFTTKILYIRIQCSIILIYYSNYLFPNFISKFQKINKKNRKKTQQNQDQNNNNNNKG